MSEIAWCQPNYEGKVHPRKFMVVYEDAEMGSAIFDDEAEAREHFEKASVAWNCYLFGLMPRSSFPAPRGGLEPNWWEEWVKTTRAYNALAKAAQAVIDEAKAIHDNEPWPIRYRAPYEAITKLSAVLEASDKSVAVAPPPAEIVMGPEECAALIDTMLSEAPWKDKMWARGALMIAARAIRRGRHLSDAEKLNNLYDWLENGDDASAEVEG